MAQIDVTSEIVIARPVAEVAAFAGDPSNAPLWYVDISSVHWRTTPKVDVGSQMDFVASFMGREMRYTYEIADLVPAQRLVMQTAQGPFPMRTEYTWTAVPGGTRMTLRNSGQPSGFAALLAAPVMAAAVRRANRRDLQRLKHILEGGDQEGPSHR